MSGGLQQGDLVSLTTISDAIPGLKVRINSRTSTLRQQDAIMEAAGVPAPPRSTSGKTGQQERKDRDQSSANSQTASIAY